MARELSGNAIDALLTEAGFRRNRKVKIPKLPSIVDQQSKSQQVWIYNVGPWALKRELGSAGIFFIPACPEGKEYVAATPIPGVPYETVPSQDSDHFELRIEEKGGRYLAEQVLGVGAHISKRDSFEPMGAFIGSEVGPNAKPTKKELEAARELLTEYLQSLINEARKAYEDRDQKSIVDRHRLAARLLKLENEQWYSARAAKERKDCEACGTPVNVGVKICPSCKFPIDREWYEKNKGLFAK